MAINSKTFYQFDPKRVPSPCFVIDKAVIRRNLRILQHVKEQSGAKVLLALKAFSLFNLAPLICQYLDGTCTSGLHEALLGHQEFQGNLTGVDKREVHVYSPAFTERDITALLPFVDHMVFNAINQWQRFQPAILAAKQQRPALSFGLRINPDFSQASTALYDPCNKGSRLGITVEQLQHHAACADLLAGIDGLHFHTLCEQGFEPLAKTLDVVEAQFASYLPKMRWVNFGGGHHITHPDYNVQGLIDRIKAFQEKYQVQVYLEPGEAVAIHSGVLVSEVLDTGYNRMPLAILDTSATCHMPDTLEMPYRADILTVANGQYEMAGTKDEKPFNYRLGGQTCLAGDIMGDYSFEQPLTIGQRLMFDDMAHYTMVKLSTFNGIALPAIAVWDSDSDELKLIKEFGYADFRNRLS